MTAGFDEGERCGRDGCEGVIECRRSENCSCHLSAPCSSCVAPREFCPACGWEAKDEPEESQIATSAAKVTPWKERELDPTRIDWRPRYHSGCSMIKEGVYPEGTTIEQVRAEVDGTFGGRFEHFGNGRFKFIA